MQKRTVAYSMAIVALLGGALGSAAIADQMRMAHGMGGPGMMAPDFATLDADKDGKITAEEFAAARKARIEGLDANADGKISRDELMGWQMRGAEQRAGQRADHMIAMMDANGDGALGADELLAMPGPGMAMAFDRFDKDGDGGVTRAEFDARGPGKDGKGHHGGRDHGSRGGNDEGCMMKGGMGGMGQGMMPPPEGN